jgi:energy-coupling factor transporter ATP-binding protein EcfA2
VFDALVVLEKRELALKAQHSDAVQAWDIAGRSGPLPSKPRAPLARLFELFTEIFPQIALSYDYDARRLSAHKNGQLYGPSTLSDGEKQVFSVLADLIELDDAYNVIIADEPELNLHPELAERLWTLIEQEFPEKLFVYATHSINFALRENVDKVFVLSSDSESIGEFHGLDELPRGEARAFLGGLPGLLSTNSVVVTEGHEKSFDALFFRWLLGDSRVEVFPAGGCADVVSVVSKSGIWSKVSTKVTLRGVTDSDFRDAGYLASMHARGVTVLRLHEAESYLCLPDVASRLAERIGSQESLLGVSEVEGMILDSLQGQRIAIAARRVFARTRITLAVSVERRVLAAASSRDAVLAEIERVSLEELAKAEAALDAKELGSMLDSELAAIDRVLEAKETTAALQLLPAKPLLQSLASRAGCRTPADLMRSLKHNFSPSDFEVLAALREEIMASS